MWATLNGKSQATVSVSPQRGSAGWSVAGRRTVFRPYTRLPLDLDLYFPHVGLDPSSALVRRFLDFARLSRRKLLESR